MPATSRPTTVLSTKGQVILPKSIREHRKWSPGTRLVVEETEDGVLLRAAPLFARTAIDEVSGCLKVDGSARAIEEMDQAVAGMFRRQHAGD